MTRAVPLLLLLAVLLAPVASAADITIPGFSYSPARFETTPGATVTVTNLDTAPHSVKHASFDSGVLDQDQTGTFTAPTTPGEYPYVCGVHGSSMKGTLVVRDAAAGGTPAPPTPATPSPAPASPTPASPTASAPSTPTPSTPAATSTGATPPPTPTPAAGEGASTPGPGLALVLLALVVALLAARRRLG